MSKDMPKHNITTCGIIKSEDKERKFERHASIDDMIMPKHKITTYA